jgi:hypothetical protein
LSSGIFSLEFINDRLPFCGRGIRTKDDQLANRIEELVVLFQPSRELFDRLILVFDHLALSSLAPVSEVVVGGLKDRDSDEPETEDKQDRPGKPWRHPLRKLVVRLVCRLKKS